MALVPRYRLVSRILILEIVVRVELINIKEVGWNCHLRIVYGFVCFKLVIMRNIL